MSETIALYERHRFPAAIIAHAVWLYLRFSLSLRAVEEMLQPRRDSKAAMRLLRRLMKKTDQASKRIVTDKMRSYAAAKREVAPGLGHRAHKGLNNRAETQQPRREQPSAVSIP